MPSLLRLQVHPQTHDAPTTTVEVAVGRDAGQLTLQYQISGEVAALRLPVPAESQRRDELWRHTCAELFVAAPNRNDYLEFNFAPSREWAAYQFDDYRTGMRSIECMPPRIKVWHDAQMLRMTVQCQLPTSWAMSVSLQLGVTMVIEDRERGISYWALKHPGDKPDFHHRAAFVLAI